MAALPPRKNATPTKLSWQNLTPLQILLQMGFPKHRAEKALAATGYKSVQLASDWLLAHVNDPTIDDKQPRDYILYICPTGPFLDQLQNFWSKSLNECGRNGAHTFMPHVTLISYFKAPDDIVPHLCNTLGEIAEQHRSSYPAQISLETYTSPNFMGFFLREDCAEFFKKIAMQFVKELSPMTIAAEAQNQALHLTLAYHFPSNQYSNLETLVKEIFPNTPAYWQLRLYSRDARLAGKEVYRVVYPHVPREPDELELLIGDFIYIDVEHWKTSVDGWVEGISWLTGCSGFLPQNYVEKTAESDAWTLHKVIRFHANDTPGDEIDPPRPGSQNRLLSTGRSVSDQTLITSEASSSDVNPEEDKREGSIYDNLEDNNVKKLSSSIKKHCPVRPSSVEWPLVVKQSPRNIFIVRHGERVDFTFGAWIPYCFDENGKYIRKDLNMPLTVPVRKGSPDSFFKDCPLTCVGEMQARLLGEALKLSGVDIDHVYSSPSLRCLLTCRNILRGLSLDDKLPIALEPGLFEWLIWYQDSLPQFLSLDEVSEAGFKLKKDYKQFITFPELDDRRESCEQYYMRSHYVVQSILRSTAHIGGNILMIGHAATLDACSRQLIGGAPRTGNELSRLLSRIPYCSMATVQQNEENKTMLSDSTDLKTEVSDTPSWSQGQWKLIEPPVPPMTHSANIRFDWQALL